MIPRSWFLHCAVFATVILGLSPALSAQEQSALEESTPPAAPIQSLGLTDSQRSELQNAVGTRDYLTAEKLLLSEINKDPHSQRAAKLLAYVGSVYFLNADYLNAAIALKKSDAIAPLAPTLQFSLAMAYIRISHSDWARKIRRKGCIPIGSAASTTTVTIIRVRSGISGMRLNCLRGWPARMTILGFATFTKTKTIWQLRITRKQLSSTEERRIPHRGRI
jgi:hypothetical protein